MKDQIGKIRELLDEIETHSSQSETESDRNFSALELPTIIQEIVDDLQPLLTPYDAAFYWYAFRHSIAKNGEPHVRLSSRGMQSGKIKSSNSNNGVISLGKVRETLSALEDIGALRKEGEANRDGTLYRVLIPDEIPACQKFRSERIANELKPSINATDIDHYNVRENRIKIFDRDSYKCHYCQKQLTRFTATLDHVRAVAEGGDNSFDNLVTACLSCNSRKHKRLMSDFLAESQ